MIWQACWPLDLSGHDAVVNHADTVVANAVFDHVGDGDDVWYAFEDPAPARIVFGGNIRGFDDPLDSAVYSSGFSEVGVDQVGLILSKESCAFGPEQGVVAVIFRLVAEELHMAVEPVAV